MRTVRDAALKVSKALPASNTNAVSDGIDIKGASGKEFAADCEAVIEAPALAVGELSNGATMTYDVEHSDDNATFTPLAKSVGVQTGANGAGAAATTYRFRMPSTVKRYVRFKATASANLDASGKSAVLRFVF